MKSPGPIGVGLVGAGMVASHHADAVAALPGVRLVGVTDLDRARAEGLAARYPGTAAFGSVGALCDAGARVIHVLTPPATHAAVALEALERGSDVLVEKPLATDVADCDRLADAAERHGRRVGVSHSLLLDPWIVRLRSMVAGGRIGTLASAEYVCTAEYPPWAGGAVPPHYRDGGYPFRDLGVHGLYLLRALLGEIHGVQVERSGRGGDPNLAFDEWHVLVRCARGTGRIRLSWNARPLETYLVVHGERGTLRADVGRLFLGRRLARGLPAPVARTLNTLEDAAAALVAVPRSVVGLATGRLKPYGGLRATVAAFHRALADGTPLPASLDDGREVVRWVEEVARPADLAKRHRAWRFAPRRPSLAIVTGAGGFLGGALVRRLAADGTSVRALVRREPPAGTLDQPGVEVVLADLGDAAAVAAALEDACVAYHVGAAMRGGPEEHERGTVAGTRHVVEGCLAHGVRLMHVSSLSVLHWAGLHAGAIVREDAPLEPSPHLRGHYTRAKSAAEAIVMEAVRFRGLQAIVVRPGQIVGPGHWAPGTVDGVRAGGRLVVLGDPQSILPIVHVDDVVDALLRTAGGGIPAGTVYHLVDERTITRETLACAIAAAEGLRPLAVPAAILQSAAFGCEVLGRVLGRDVPLTRYRLRSTFARVRFDCGRAARDLGWRPRAAVLTPAFVAVPDNASAAPGCAQATDTPTASHAPDGAPVAAAR
jgi:predicted dehydrogenase/nucleoside-diphosphate-sugar epimerase